MTPPSSPTHYQDQGYGRRASLCYAETDEKDAENVTFHEAEEMEPAEDNKVAFHAEPIYEAAEETSYAKMALVAATVLTFSFIYFAFLGRKPST